MILVSGATGYLGGAVCHTLAAQGRRVRALVRSSSAAEKVAALQAAGVETVVGDLKDPASLAAACQDVRAVISTASSTLSRADGDDIESVDRAGNLALVAAARAAGAGHLVFVSFPPTPGAFPLQDAKRAVEEAIHATGLPYTILQPTHFREVWFSPPLGFDAAVGKAQLLGDAAGPISWIGLGDVCAAVVASLDNPKAVNRTIPLGGPEALTQAEVVARFEARTGRSFEKATVPVAALEAMAASPDPLQRSLAALMLVCSRGGCTIDPADATNLLGLQASPIDDFIAAFGG